MTYYWKVKVVRQSGRTVLKSFAGYDYEKECLNARHAVSDYVRKCIGMPATVRVEVEEEDTQLFAYPPEQRRYPKAVVLKDGRAWQFYGHAANAAFLHAGPLRSFNID